MGNHDALLDRAAGLQRQGPRCWAEHLQGEAKDFLAAVEARRAKGEHFPYSNLSDLFKSEFGVSVAPAAVGNHLRGRCRCGR